MKESKMKREEVVKLVEDCNKKLRELKRGLQQKGQSSDTSDEDKFKQMKEEAEAVLSEYDRVLLRFKREPLENWS